MKKLLCLSVLSALAIASTTTKLDVDTQVLNENGDFYGYPFMLKSNSEETFSPANAIIFSNGKIDHQKLREMKLRKAKINNFKVSSKSTQNYNLEESNRNYDLLLEKGYAVGLLSNSLGNSAEMIEEGRLIPNFEYTAFTPKALKVWNNLEKHYKKQADKYFYDYKFKFIALYNPLNLREVGTTLAPNGFVWVALNSHNKYRTTDCYYVPNEFKLPNVNITSYQMDCKNLREQLHPYKVNGQVNYRFIGLEQK